jgi:hypothetical protein
MRLWPFILGVFAAVVCTEKPLKRKTAGGARLLQLRIRRRQELRVCNIATVPG